MADDADQEDINALKEKLSSARKRGVGRDKTNKKQRVHGSDVDADSMNVGMRAGSELLVGMIAGGLIGYGLDYWIGTKAIFSVLFLILGVGVGFLNIYKLTQNIGTSVGFAEMHQRQKKDDNDDNVK